MRNKLTALDRAFLFSTVLGAAAAYSVVYLFHLVLALKILVSAGSAEDRRTGMWRYLRRDVLFFGFFFTWYVVSIAWADNKLYAVQYCAYVLLASLTVFYVVQICRSPRRLEQAFKFVFFLAIAEITLSAMEGLEIIRLPFSPFSPYYTYFGREPQDLSGYGIWTLEYISSLPTGFFGNPNNLAAFLGLVLPLFLLHQNWLIRVFGSLLIFYVVYMCGARSVMIACMLVLLTCALVWGRFAGRFGAVLGALLALILAPTIVGVLSGSSSYRVSELQDLSGTVTEFLYGLSGEQVGYGSAGARAQLIRNGLDALWASNGLGVGAGGSWTIQEQSTHQVRDLTSMHNFWVELLVEGGVLFGALFVVWYAVFLWRLWRIGKSSLSRRLRYLARALFAGFIGFVVGAVGPSTVIYMLPVWMVVGLGLAVIGMDGLLGERFKAHACAQRRQSGEVSRPSFPPARLGPSQ